MMRRHVNPADEADREVVRADVASTVVVEAAAGTGKTTELVARIVATLTAGVDVGRIAVVTFTEKAAGEVKLRLRAELERARLAATAGEPGARALQDAVLRLEEARIGTIHAFCADLLRERPIEAGIDPAFDGLAEDEAEDLFAIAFDAWFEHAIDPPSPALRRALRRRGGEGPVAALRAAARDLARHADLDAPWTRATWDRASAVESVVDAAREVVGCLPACTSTVLHDHVAPVRELVGVADVTPGAIDDLEAAAVALARHPKLLRDVPRAGGRGVAPLLDALTALHRAVEAFTAASDAELAALLREELRGAVASYAAHKAERGALDFDDLLLRARDLLERSAPARAALQQRFDRLFVDEFQDTDAVQAAILLLLAGDDPAIADAHLVRPAPGKLFVVGDPKQSIYRFRRADLGTYFAVRDRLAASGARLVSLRSSFRAVPSIQRLVNAAFAPAMVEDREALQPGYVPLDGVGASDPVGQPAIVALPAPHPFGKRGGVTKTAVTACLPAAVAAFVAWLLHDSGWTVRDPEGDGRIPIEPRHVCLLFKNFQSFQGDVTSPYAAALDARGVPVVLVGGKKLFDREETLALVAAASAIEWPGDLLEVWSTLRGSLFAIPDELLLVWRARYGTLDPRRPPITAIPRDMEPVADALAILRGLHHGRRRRPPVETMERLLAAARAHVSLALRPAGEQALANVAAVLELARRQEKRGALSFRAFVAHLREEVARRRAPEPPILEEESEGVRMMTVHKAKGLEFPVVVLADPMPNAAPMAASRIVDPERGLYAFKIAGGAPLDVVAGSDRELARDRAESTRLAYVAATRARDLLVVPMVGDSPVFPAGGWLAPLQQAMVPAPHARPEPSPGCPAFGLDAVVRSIDVPGPSEESLTPGTYQLASGARITVWDPNVLDLGHPRPRGLRGVDLVEERADAPAVAAEGKAALAAFRVAHREAVARGAVPSEVVVTATALSHPEETASEEARVDAGDRDAADGATPGAPAQLDPVLASVDPSRVTLESVVREPGRPRGHRFGDLVHQLLAIAAAGSAAPALDAEAAVRARTLGLDEATATAGARAARIALAHPLLVAAAEAAARGECRRECPITQVLDGGRVLEGVVDLAFRQAGRWTVVDFKTDAFLDDDRKLAYARQVALYAQAITAATGEPCDGALLLV